VIGGPAVAGARSRALNVNSGQRPGTPLSS
jgi:hypothetical protein